MRQILTLFLLIFLFAPVSAKIFDSDDWRLSDKGIEFVEKDNQQVIKITRGELTYTAEPMRDGEIEFEMMSEGERAFVYAYFRELSENESEVVYMRTHKSNAPDTVQYSPVLQGRSAWQLYHGDSGTAKATLPSNTWIKVKLSVKAERLNMWVADQQVFKDLLLTGTSEAGTVTLRGNIPRASDASYSTYLRNIVVTPEQPAQLPAKSALDAQTIQTSRSAPKQWQTVMKTRLSGVFAAEKVATLELPQEIATGDWTDVQAQSDGVFELLRLREIPDELRRYAVAAEFSATSSEAQTCKLHLGFSDAITVSLNQQPLGFADASYRYQQNRQEGLLHPSQMTLFIPLREGKNTLRTVVADSFGGWGFQAAFEGCKNITLD